MKTRGCTSQRKTTKVRLAPPPGQGPSAGSRPPRPLRLAPGPVPAELPGAPPPRPGGGTRARTPRDRAENSRPSPSRAGFFGACVSYEIPGEGEKFPKCLLLPRLFAFAWKAQLPGPPRAGKVGAAVLPPRRPGARASLRARLGARARTPHQAGPAPGPPPGVPLAPRAPCPGPRAPGPRRQMRASAPRSSLPPLTAPPPLTPRVPTPPCSYSHPHVG